MLFAVSPSFPPPLAAAALTAVVREWFLLFWNVTEMHSHSLSVLRPYRASCRRITLRFIHVAACVSISLLFIAG